MADAAAFAQHAEGVARLLLGDENKRLSSKNELRFGANGSLSVDIRDGKCFDHEEKVGGGLLWLIERQTKCKGRAAVEWMNEHGFTIESERPAYEPARPPGRTARGSRTGASCRASPRKPSSSPPSTTPT